MLHHLKHGHHQQDDIDLSKQTRLRIDRLHLDGHPVSIVTVNAAALLVNTDIMIVSFQSGNPPAFTELLSFQKKKRT